MNNDKNKINIRWFYLSIGSFSMLFAGIIYAWSILKLPFSQDFAWAPESLALNFTLTMCCFCFGGFLGSLIAKKLGSLITLIISGFATMAGFLISSFLTETSIILLYISYGILAGTGIGIAYNVIIGIVSKWFPDKKGICSGFLMMGFGASALVLGNLANSLFENSSFGWRKTYILLGVSIGVVLIIAGLFLRKPSDEIIFPKAKEKKTKPGEMFETVDYSSLQMIKRPSFWFAFAFLTFLGAVGSTVISFAKDLAVSVSATASLATTLVGVLSICNGLGRIITGIIFDTFGRKKTMFVANILTIFAAGAILLSVIIKSLPLCIVGLCLTGLSYGSCPTICVAFTSAFYGMKYLPTNVSLMTCNLVFASFVATLSSKLLTISNGYVIPFVLLLALSTIALVLNLFLRKP